MKLINIALFNLRRISRYRLIIVCLIAIPIIFHTARICGIDFNAAASYLLFPLLYALFATLIAFFQYKMDEVNGLSAGFLTATFTCNQLIISRILSGSILFAIQMLIHFLIFAIK
jgi:hypothetical protein